MDPLTEEMEGAWIYETSELDEERGILDRARVYIARWYRSLKRRKLVSDPVDDPETERALQIEKELQSFGSKLVSVSPITVLSRVSHCQAAQQYLRHQLSSFQSFHHTHDHTTGVLEDVEEQIENEWNKAAVLFALQRYHACARSLATVYRLRKALATQSAFQVPQSTILHDRHRLRYILLALQGQNQLGEKRSRETWIVKGKRTLPIDRRENLSVKEFYEAYALKKRPVIIVGGAKFACGKNQSLWTFDFVRHHLGPYKGKVRKFIPHSIQWAEMEESHSEISIAEFLSLHIASDSPKDDEPNLSQDETRSPDYFFDWSLPAHCEESFLRQHFSFPSYFENDYLKRTKPGTLNDKSWPSLFLGPKNTGGGLHIDAFGSNFWMALFQGRKRWIIFQPEDFSKLQPRYENISLEPVFTVHEKMTNDLPRYDFILEAGDLLFVPAGSPHRVLNIEDSLAISYNYVDASNFDQVKKELHVAALQCPRAKDLYEQMSRSTFDTSMSFSSSPSIPYPTNVS